jgi:predicted O-methyltransferase YrrM
MAGLEAVADARHHFTAEWSTENRWQFEKHLSHLRGKINRVLEIGCFEGQGTCWLLENVLTTPDSHIVCIDIFEQSAFWPNIAASRGSERVVLKIGKSRDVLPSLERGSFDFIFIGGSHAAADVLEDAVLSFRLAKVGAIVAFDDYKWKLSTDRPKKSIDAFLSIYQSKIEVMTKNHQVWIRKTAD